MEKSHSNVKSVAKASSEFTPSSPPKRDSTLERSHTNVRCGKGFKWSLNLDMHQRSTGEKPYKCGSVGSTSQSGLKSSASVRCPLREALQMWPCGSRSLQSVFTASVSQASPHRRNLYKCEVCGRNFSWRSNLVSHHKLHGDIWKWWGGGKNIRELSKEERSSTKWLFQKTHAATILASVRSHRREGIAMLKQ